MRNGRVAGTLVATLALAGSVGLGACGDDSDSSGSDLLGGLVYEDPQGRFSMELPKDWIQDRSGADDVNVAFVTTRPDTSTGRPYSTNIRLTITENVDTSLDEAAVAQRDSNVRDLSGYVPDIDETVELADGTPARLLGGIYQQENLRLQTVQLLVSDDRVGYTVSATHPVRTYAEHEAELRASLLSFDTE